VATCEQHIAAETEIKPCAGADDGGIVAYAEQQVGVGWLGAGEVAADEAKFGKRGVGHFQAALVWDGLVGGISGCLWGGQLVLGLECKRCDYTLHYGAKAA